MVNLHLFNRRLAPPVLLLSRYNIRRVPIFSPTSSTITKLEVPASPSPSSLSGITASNLISSIFSPSSSTSTHVPPPPQPQPPPSLTSNSFSSIFASHLTGLPINSGFKLVPEFRIQFPNHLARSIFSRVCYSPPFFVLFQTYFNRSKQPKPEKQPNPEKQKYPNRRRKTKRRKTRAQIEWDRRNGFDKNPKNEEKHARSRGQIPKSTKKTKKLELESESDSDLEYVKPELISEEEDEEEEEESGKPLDQKPEGESFICIRCVEVWYEKEEQLDKHYERRHTELWDKKIKCSECSNYFDTKEDLKAHQLSDDCPGRTGKGLD